MMMYSLVMKRQASVSILCFYGLARAEENEPDIEFPFSFFVSDMWFTSMVEWDRNCCRKSKHRHKVVFYFLEKKRKDRPR